MKASASTRHMFAKYTYLLRPWSLNATLQACMAVLRIIVVRFFCRLLFRLRRARLLCERELERSRHWQNSWVTVSVAKYRTKAGVVTTGICHPPSPVETAANGWATPDGVAVLFKPEHAIFVDFAWVERTRRRKKQTRWIHQEAICLKINYNNKITLNSRDNLMGLCKCAT